MALNSGKVIYNLGRRIAELREQLGLTQAELARRFHVGPKRMQKIESGTSNLTIRTIVELAILLKKSLAEMLEPPGPHSAPRIGRPRKRPPKETPRP